MSVSDLLNKATGDMKAFPVISEGIPAKVIAEKNGVRLYNDMYEEVFEYKDVQVFNNHFGHYFGMHPSDILTKDSDCVITFKDSDKHKIMIQNDTWIPGPGDPLVAQRIIGKPVELNIEEIPEKGIHGYGYAMTDGVLIVDIRGYSVMAPYNRVSMGGDAQSGSWYEGTLLRYNSEVLFMDMVDAHEMVADLWHE